MDALLNAIDSSGIDHLMISDMTLVKKWDVADPRQPLYYLEADSRAYWYSATGVFVAETFKALPADKRRTFHQFISGFNPMDRNAVDHVKRMLEWYPGVWEGIGEVMGRYDDLTALIYSETSRAILLWMQSMNLRQSMTCLCLCITISVRCGLMSHCIYTRWKMPSSVILKHASSGRMQE